MLKKVELKTPLPLYYLGPDLSEGPLPCVFYFALSATETLLTDPFNQPVSHLKNSSLRIFSVDLPYHGKNLPATEALKCWAQAFARGEDVLGDFLLNLKESISMLLSSGSIETTRIAVVGLSRGGFIASHIAAKFPEISTLLIFAPLTHLEAILEFDFLSPSPLIKNLNMSYLTEALSTKAVKAYIGGRDTRVGTDLCYKWIKSLIETAYEKNIKSPPIEFVLKPSIGYLGHGTSKLSFEEGAEWIIQQLKI